MLTIKQWFRTQAFIPLIVLTSLVLTIWIVFIGNQYFSVKESQTNQINQQANLMQLPVVRNDRVILESLLGSYFLNLKAKSIAICKAKKPYMSLGWKASLCDQKSSGITSRVVVGTIGGLEEYFLVADLPLFPSGTIWYLVLPGSLLAIFCIIIVFRLSRSIKTSILIPLQNEYLGENIKIKEVRDLLEKQELAKQVEAFRATYKIAKQVAHDIRSPLSCLGTIAKRSKGLSEQESKLITDSILRINEVAEDLLKKERAKNMNTSIPIKEIIDSNYEANSSIVDNVNLSKLIIELVNLKAMEYSGNEDIKIVSSIEPDVENINYRIEPKKFRRILSNLINNAVEALKPDQKGFISTSFSKEDENLILEVRDNGKGISEENICKILDEGISIGKKNGNGMGISYAKQVIESVNGNLKIFSREGFGTTVKITLLPQ